MSNRFLIFCFKTDDIIFRCTLFIFMCQKRYLIIVYSSFLILIFLVFDNLKNGYDRVIHRDSPVFWLHSSPESPNFWMMLRASRARSFASLTIFTSNLASSYPVLFALVYFNRRHGAEVSTVPPETVGRCRTLCISILVPEAGRLFRIT